MSRWTEGQVLEALQLAVPTDVGNGGRPDASSFASVATDTRTLDDGALFVALHGDRFDGHDFLARAAESGAHAAAAARAPEDAPPLRSYRAPGTLTPPGRQARHRRPAASGPAAEVARCPATACGGSSRCRR